jgi:hypothetical protein
MNIQSIHESYEHHVQKQNLLQRCLQVEQRGFKKTQILKALVALIQKKMK